MAEAYGYLGNPLLKRAGETYQFSQHELSELIKCRNDILYFANYVKIQHPDQGFIKFEPYEYQRRLLPMMQKERFVIVKNPRQSGKTVTSLVFLLHFVIFNSDKSIAVLANKEKVAAEILGRLKIAYEYLPMFLQQGVVEWNKGNIELENRSQIHAFATSQSSARSYSFSCIFVDECAFIANKLWDPYWKSVYPTVSAGTETKVIIVSTPNGMNHFYKLWTDAENGRNEFKPFGINWWDIPGRDEAWKKQTIGVLGPDGWKQEYETEFIGSSFTLISPTALQNLAFVDPVFSKNSIDIYEKPTEGRKYVICVDTSKGTGQDYCAFSIIDTTDAPYKQVGKYRNNEVSPDMEFPNIIHSTAQRYNNALVLVENTDLGEQVAKIVYRDLEYENILWVVFKGRSGQHLSGGFKRGARPGLTMSTAVKRIGCAKLKELVEKEVLLIQDFDTISELTTFVDNGKGSYASDGDTNDDLVMTLVLFSWVITQDHFSELRDRTVKQDIQKIQGSSEDDEILLPYPIYSDGVQEPKYEPDEYERDADGTIWVPATWDPNSIFGNSHISN